jgi:hypothetical protein
MGETSEITAETSDLSGKEDVPRWRSVRAFATREGLGIALRHLLDCLIAVELLGIVLVLTTGGFTLPWLRVARVAKPLLILVIAVPIRIAFGGKT